MDLARLWRDREHFVLLDAGFGSGARLAGIVDAWRADPRRSGRLHVIGLQAAAPLPGFERSFHEGGKVLLDRVSGAFEDCLPQLDARVDAVMLHGVEQAGTRWMQALARLSAPGTVLDGHGLTHAQLLALRSIGYAWEPGGEGALGATFASRKPRPARSPLPERRAVVIGAGVAGCAASERLCARGWQVTLVERHAQPAGEASGNLAGIFMPLLSKDDNIPTRLSRAAYRFALHYWERLGGVGTAFAGAQCGVLQLARDPAHAAVQRDLAALWKHPSDYALWLNSAEASTRFGRPAPDGGWWFARGGWARPASACDAMLAACGALLARRFGTGSVSLEDAGGEWLVRDAHGAVVASAPTVILANGTGAVDLAQGAGLPLVAVRGQVTHLAAGTVPSLPFVLCREAYVTPPADGIVCTGASYDLDAERALRQSSQDDNLDKMRSMFGDASLAAAAPLAGRVGFRCVAPDRLPLVGALPNPALATHTERLREVPRWPGVHGLLGYASRGLIWAPLAAELLASQLENQPLPVEAALATALDPARFLLRGRRSNNSIEIGP